MRPSDSAAPRGSSPIPAPPPAPAPTAEPCGTAAAPADAPERPAPAAGRRTGLPATAPPGPPAEPAHLPGAEPYVPRGAEPYVSRGAERCVSGGAEPCRSGEDEPHLSLVWSADRDAVPREQQDAVRVLTRTDVLHALRCADRRIVRALRECGADPRVAAAARVLGLTGEHAAVWLGAGLAGALGDTARRGQWLRATAAVGAAHLAGMGLKRAVRRPRPHLPGAPPLVRTAGGHSFPSAHAASSAAAVVAYGALLPGGAAVPALAAAICVARLVAGVHYPSDVAAGALLGAAVARASGGGRRG